MGDVHCRTGSLEKRVIGMKIIGKVHCRTGSLEKLHIQQNQKKHSSLPHRQLRNIESA